MYSVRLDPIEGVYNANIVAHESENWLLDCVGISEKTEDDAIYSAECRLPSDEVGVYYTVEAVYFEIEEED